MAPLVLGTLSRKLRWVTAMAFCLLLAVALVPAVRWLSFQQGRWAGEPVRPDYGDGGSGWRGSRRASLKSNPDYAATANGVVFGLFPNRLKLRDEPIVGREKLDKTKEEIASRGGEFVPTITLDDRDLQAAGIGRRRRSTWRFTERRDAPRRKLGIRETGWCPVKSASCRVRTSKVRSWNVSAYRTRSSGVRNSMIR